MFANPRRSLFAGAALLAIASLASGARPASAEDDGIYKQTNLVSDIPGLAATTDPDLVNAWGISFSATSPFWVSDNGSGKATLYTGTGTKLGLVVTIPPPAGSPPGTVSAPTGQVFNGSGDFAVSAGGKSGVARFIFATEDGTISGWSPGVDLTHAILAVDRSADLVVYKGLAMVSTAHGMRLFATDLRHGTVDVFDGSFHLIASWSDPGAPAMFAPFNVREVGGQLVVTFAKQNDEAHDDVAGRGNGLIDIVDPDTLAFRRFVTGHGAGGSSPFLNSPWGVALAPASFGKFGGALLVGNFGDGRINAFDPRTARWLGRLKDAEHHALVIDGLWAITFGNSGTGSSPDTLYFTAGPDGEHHGLLGSLVPVMEDEGDN